MVRKEFPQVRLIESGSNLGFGRAHNLIAQYAQGPLVLFLNPDCRFVEDAVTPIIRIFNTHADVGLVGCRMINEEGSTQPLGFQCHTSPWSEFVGSALASRWTMAWARRVLPFHDPLQDGYVRKLYGGCLAATRKALDRVGWFDERFFMYGEDVDLSRKVEAAGWRLYYTSGTKVMHLCGGATANVPGRFSVLMQCESIAKLMEKYYGRLGRSFYALLISCRAIARLFLAGSAVILLRSTGQRSRAEACSRSWTKNLAMLKWSVGLERAHVPR